MELFTLNREYEKVDIIDAFTSCIWTERYYGDSEFELTLPISIEALQKLSPGIFLGEINSDELMSVETINIEDGLIKAKGIGILPWMDNRFIRTSPAHEDRYVHLSGGSQGWVLWAILFYSAVGGPYLDGTTPNGIPDPERLIIPGLGLDDYDRSGPIMDVAVPFGPAYKAMKELAQTYEVGMKIFYDPGVNAPLKFRSYRGLDRSSDQNDNPVVRFSPQLESLTDIKELASIAGFKNLIFTFAPGNPDGLATTPGEASLGSGNTGFDLRALMVFAEDITTDQVGGSSATLLTLLNNRADAALAENAYVVAVDGEIVQDSQFAYGQHYFLGDIIEVQGNSGYIQRARITEYIRTQDASGQKAYPTVTMIG